MRGAGAVLNVRFRLALVLAACAVPAPALLSALDRSAAFANEAPLLSGERRSIEGLRRHAADSLRAGEFATSAAVSRRILLRHPLDRSALRLLAMAETGLGHEERAGEIAIAASFVSWRDPYVEGRMYDLTSSLGRLGDAARRADAISRAPKSRTIGFRDLNLLLLRPGGAQAVAGRIATRPPWRDDYFQNVRSGLGAVPRRAVPLLVALSKTGAPASASEVDRVMAIMVARGEAATAWAYWRSRHGKNSASLIDDPHFQSARATEPGQASSPFVWSLPADTLVRLSDRRDAAGRPALRIEARGDRSVFFISRRVVITPGRYRLSYQAEGDAAQRERLHADVRCSDSVSIRLDPQGGPNSTTSTFDVPQGCSLLRLGFTIEAGESAAASELSIRGVSLSRL
jgi:hypothetical protein